MKNYGKKEQIGYGQSLDQYLADLAAVFTEVWHCTRRTGSLWIVINTVKKDNTLHLLPFKLAQQLATQPGANWHLQDILVWVKSHTLPWSHRQKLQDHFEYVLCFSKSKSFSLNTDALRSPQALANWWVKYPERYHPLGKGLNNVWEIQIPTQGSWGNGSMEHACPLPTELTKRIIQLSTDKTGVVFDPFAGTGASVVGAEVLGRRWLAMDINPHYRDMCYRRLAEEANSHAAEVKESKSLRDANLHLRQLKYPVLLYRRIAPSLRLTSTEVPLMVVKSGTILRKPSPNWVTSCEIVIVVRDCAKAKRIREVLDAIDDQRHVAPFSKFQIETEIRVVRHAGLAELGLFPAGSELHLYTCGHFWRSASKLSIDSIGTIKNRSLFPAVVSNIRVKEQPAY